MKANLAEVTQDNFVPGIYAVCARGNGTYKHVMATAVRCGAECLVPMNDRGAPVLGYKYAFVSFPDYKSFDRFVGEGIAHFMGSNSLPALPLTFQDQTRLYGLDERIGQTLKAFSGDWVTGEIGVITDGPFKGKKAVISGTDRAKREVGVTVVMFGRETVCSLPLTHIVREEFYMDESKARAAAQPQAR